MKELLKSHITRLTHSKVMLWMLILCGIFMVLPIAVYYLNNSSAELADEKYTIVNVFSNTLASGTSNIALIVSICLIIIFSKEFSYGTIRNKITTGHSRLSIYLSVLIVNTIIYLSLSLIYTLFITLFSSLFCDLAPAGYNANAGYFIIRYLLSAVFAIPFIAFVTFLIFTVRRSGVCILMYILFVSIFISLLQLITIINNSFVEALYKCLIPYFETILTSYDSVISGADVLRLVLSSCILAAIFGILGGYLFIKKDIK